MSQNKNIIKTVLILVVAMATILLLFLNKITTPRYLSDVELRINGLILVKEKQQLIPSDIEKSDQWFLIAQNEKDEKTVEKFLAAAKKSIRTKMTSAELDSIVVTKNALPEQTILLANPQGQLVAYLKPPYDQHKMLLTLSSVITHRE